MISDPADVLSRYDVSPRYGFLPDQPPLERLSNEYYRPWECIMDQLPVLIRHHRVRGIVDELPVFDTSKLSSEEEWRRAYLVLSFITQAYIWGHPNPSQVVPSQICIPLLEAADHFGLPAVATYSSFNLWNWIARSSGADITDPENVEMVSSFTGTTDEAWFFIISVSIEAEGGKVIPKTLECFDAIAAGQSSTAVQLLRELVNCIVRLGEILDRMHDKCDPQVFYHDVRPFLAGSKGMADAGLPNGVFYDEGNGAGIWRQYSGGSNAQSTLIQFLDIVLGVEHSATNGEAPAPGSMATKKAQGYLEEMRQYMPRGHRQFLQYVAEKANIRGYASKCDADSRFRRTYVDALDSLATVRNKHLNLVARYIIGPSRRPMSPKQDKDVRNIASATSKKSNRKGSDESEFQGTGGTNLMSFLKQTRDETRFAIELPSAA